MSKKQDKSEDKIYKPRSRKSSIEDIVEYNEPGEELRARGIYYITDIIDTDSLVIIHQDIILKSLNSNWNNDIQLMINSPGGDSAECWSLVDLLEWIRFDVQTIAMGECCSAGSILTSCGTKGKRYIAPNTSFMVHGPWTSSIRGNLHQLNSEIKAFRDEHMKSVNFWTKHSKYTTQEDVEKYLITQQDNWFTAEEALDHGLVDHIIGQEELIKKDHKKKGKK